MLKDMAIGLVMLLLLSSGCATLNNGTGTPHRTTLIMHAPQGAGSSAPGLFGGENATFSASTGDPNGPFRFEWDFGGAAENTTTFLSTAGIATVTVRLLEPTASLTYTATVTMHTADGRVASDSVMFTFADNMPIDHRFNTIVVE